MDVYTTALFDRYIPRSIDSLQLLEEGYEVLSTDGSEPMVDQARMSREQRKTDDAFKNWGNYKCVHIELHVYCTIKQIFSS